MSESMTPPNDELLAFMRGELDASAERELLDRIRHDPALQRELDWLRQAAGAAFADGARAADAQAFARLRQRIAAAASPTPDVRPGFFAMFQEWWRAHNSVLQGALAVLVIAQAVALAGILTWHASPNPASSPAMVRGAGESCLVVHVRFKAGVREDAIGMWLTEYNASIVAGPSASGVYAIRLPDAGTLRQFIRDPQAANLAEKIQQTTGCSK